MVAELNIKLVHLKISLSLFKFKGPLDSRLDATDATYVDAYHTNAGDLNGGYFGYNGKNFILFDLL
jgi:hypothetical protein